MPSPKAPAAKPHMTDVLGYFNRNNFPISITSDQLGINTQVLPKAYVVDREGRKINDPRLDHWTRQGGLLSKEFSKDPVPQILLAGGPPATAPAVAPKPPVAGVIGTGTLPNKLPAANASVPAKLVPQAVAPAPTTGSTSIRAMSVAEAQGSGLIPRSRADKWDRLPNEDKDGGAARTAPFIDQVTPMPRQNVPASLKLRTADVSGVTALGAPDAVAATGVTVEAEVAPPADDLSVAAVPAAPRAKPARAKAKPAPAAPPTVAPKPGVEYDGKIFTNMGALKNALVKKFNGDKGLADEAFQALRPQFAAAKAAAVSS